ncbi:MAG TPA: hypothetical protein VIR27_02460 [Mycobacteriales bacterium]
MTPTLTPPTSLAPPSAGDRCDRCGAQAKVRVVLPGGGDLLFCGHHARAYDAKLREIAVDIVGNEKS